MALDLPPNVAISAYAVACSARPHADEIQVQRSRQRNGAALWAVRLHGFCLNKHGEWEDEPQPSSRDDKFLQRCRFASASLAIEAARAGIPAALKSNLCRP